MSRRTKMTVWLAVVAAVVIVAGANAHLVYVAMRSQPDCVPHLRAGAAPGTGLSFRAAVSSCAPERRTGLVGDAQAPAGI